MTPPVKELLRTKRDGGTLAPGELRALAAGIGDGTLSDAQVAAFAMAVFFRGLDATELPAFTLGMRDSGAVLDWSDLDRPVLDKHSTGGVGDKVSLILAPLVAACGGATPMISGRGLGHTGGTLDKLEAIPGYDATPDAATMGRVVREVGCVIGGQTDDLAPADRRLYAIRDATGSVEAIPLIVSSILSKKLAAGLGGLVMDVKHGSGAFMADLGDARALARALVDVAVAAGLPTVALLTDMDRVLGHTAGNALEVRECVDVLTGAPGADPRLVEVTMALTRTLLDLGGLGDADPQAALDSGAAAERFASMVTALGGPADLLERPDAHLPAAPVVREVFATAPGFVTGHAVRDLGLLVTELGGGRRTEADAIDHAVGLSAVAGPGAQVGPGSRPLAVVHARDEDAADAAERALRTLIAVGDAAPPTPPVVTEELR
ncbi:thymidine phosphorylase [Baekduia soli]|uniref:Thymidine phosphorylase n=1 Tax=Baekduia soli TaxID=496014 RepID=A0A5B8U3S3_9ACTN|nr:thymidine phosphorylase [Baekduia soli]QEC47581.1 thymidine phosphorylase [Baekduia soli]